ncbi:MAG: hypothetical protein MPK62_01965 [Alphaproteobacteria bacterium]|nr:hypothetical protein [Alphaproteobacteria bacterium]MDA8029899.1 hypothetical protein [Alphaproteobacteria bacterium]
MTNYPKADMALWLRCAECGRVIYYEGGGYDFSSGGGEGIRSGMECMYFVGECGTIGGDPGCTSRRMTVLTDGEVEGIRV